MTREQVVALRLARHHLSERLPAGSAAEAAVVGLQDTPPGSAALALAARSEDPPEALDSLRLFLAGPERRDHPRGVH